MSADATLRMILLGEDKSASKALKGVGDSAEKSESKVHKLSKAAGLVLAGGLAAAGAAAIDFTKRAADDQIAQQALAKTLQNTAGATKGQIAQTEDWITAQGKLYGVSDDDLRPALQRLAEGTHSVTKAQKLASLAMNVSAGTGKSLKTVSEALLKASNGQVSGLSRYGIATKDAAGKTLSFHQVVKNMSAEFSGQAAKAAETTAGKQKILTVQINELKESIGYRLLPVMQKLVGFLIKVVNWVANNTTTVGVAIGVIGSLVAVIAAVNFAMKAWTAITKIATAVQVVWTNAQWALNIAMEANPIGLLVVAIAALVVAIVIAYKKSETFRKIVNGAFSAVKNVVVKSLSAIKGAVTAAISFIVKHWKLFAVALATILLGPLGGLVVLVVTHLKQIKAAFSDAWSAVKGLTSAAWDRIRDAVSNGAQRVVGLVRGIPGAIRGLAGLYLNAGKFLITSLFRGIVAAAKAGMGFAADLVSAIKNAINAGLHLPLQVNFDKGPLHIHATVIPALAKGGIVSRPTVALIGEAGPEAVVPLSRGGGFSGGGDIYVTVNTNGLVDKTSLMRELHAALKGYRRTTLNGAAMGLE